VSKRGTGSGSGKVISEADLARLRREGPAAVEYYESVGLAEIRSRAGNLAASGGISIFGLFALGWSPLTMIVFMLVDAVLTVLGDLLAYPIARERMRASHERDHHSGQMLLIADGLEDGTGRWADNGGAPSPGLILTIATGMTAIVCVVAVLAVARGEFDGFAKAAAEPFFLWFVGGNALLRIAGALMAAVRARLEPDGGRLIFAESGSVVVLYAGLLALVWFPITFGNAGLYMLFGALFLIRIGFGVFALIWTPLALANLKRRLKLQDFSVRKKPGSSKPSLP